MHKAIRAALVFVASSVLVPIGTLGTVLGAFLFLPLPATLPKAKAGVASSMSHVYDINGNEIAVFRQYETSIPVQQKDIPEVLKQAVVSIEDRRFYSHGGVDPQGTLRAMWADIRGQAIQGGSTITQQYVKNAYTGRTRSVARKVREAILASQLDRQAPKDEILYRYLSTIYLGGGAYGVGAATQTYFRKPVTQLTLPEAALLAGVIRAPSYYDPRLNPDGAESRRQLVLQTMLDQRRITPDQFAQASAAHVYVVGAGVPPPKGPHTDVFPPERQQTQFPYFVDYVSKYLVAKYGHDRVYRGGLRIQTSLDPTLQAQAEASIANALKGTKSPREMSLVAVEPQTGFVKALVGGRDFGASQVNLALGACPPPPKPEQSGAETSTPPADQPICVPGGGGGRQPGSSFKPFTLAKAFEEGITPDRVYSAPHTYNYRGCRNRPDCTVHNVEGEGGGAMTLRSATAHSVNTVFAQLIENVGVKPAAELAHRLGITRVNPDGTDAITGRPYGLSITLGTPDVAPLDMAAAFSVFSARGLQNPATPIVKIEEPGGNVLEDNTKREPKRVMAEVIADNVTDVLRGVISGGTGTNANINRPAAGKTGTSENFGNAWFVGYTPTLSTAVWMGNSDGEDRDPLPGGTYGGTTPARTWANFMSEALKDVPVTDFNQPAPLKPVADELDRLARGGFDAGYRRYPQQTDPGGRFEQGYPAPRVGAPVTTAPTTTTTLPIPEATTSTTRPRGGIFG
jgi:penicillin-binding protein 1A